MNIPVVIDACSLINLLRIDEEDDFLYKHLRLLDIHISDTVYNEFITNVFKNNIEDADKDRINALIPNIQNDFSLHHDEEIKKDIGQSFIDAIVSYSEHKKRYNGEMSSTLLSLVLSRCEESRINFVTDDYPAKEQFNCFFSVQQIGEIQDSVDLLINLHWLFPKEEFPLNKLKNKLIDLRAEYNKNIKNFLDDVSNLKQSLRKTDKEWKLLDDILYTYYSGKYRDFVSAINALRECNSKKIRHVRDNMPTNNDNPEMVNKVNKVLHELEKIDVFKLV